MATLVGMFKTAIAASIDKNNGQLKTRPSVKLANLKYKVSMDGKRIFVSDLAQYPNATYFGAIKIEDGLFYPKSGTEQKIIDAVVEDMSKPTNAMLREGRATGYCCICGRLLVNKTSVKYMIGPICAGRWGIDLDTMAEEDERKEQASIWDEL